LFQLALRESVGIVDVPDALAAPSTHKKINLRQLLNG
jgi:hypothetical protein